MKYAVINFWSTKGLLFDTQKEAETFIEVERYKGNHWNLITVQNYEDYKEQQKYINDYYKKVLTSN